MPLSIDNGIVTINEMVGETLVNVCDQEESVAITKSYTVENENHIALQGEYDGSCRPVVHGNTLVNHNADWDGKVQTGVETSASGIVDVQVEGIKGQEVSVVVEGNTVLNHALGKTSAVVSDVYENLHVFKDINDFHSLNSGASIKGQQFIINANGKYINFMLKPLPTIKPSTTYTVIVNVISNTLDAVTRIAGGIEDTVQLYSESSIIEIPPGSTEKIIHTVKSNNDFTNAPRLMTTFVDRATTGSIVLSIELYEGDHTTNPKYVNSNEGNYVDLTVANDMSSVVEIEGRTMYYNNDTGEYLYEFVENSNLSLKSSYECEVTEDGK